VLSDHVVADGGALVGMLEEALAGLDASAIALRARTLCALSTHLWYAAAVDRRRELAEQALAAARASGDVGILAAALIANRNAHHAPAHLSERLRLDAEAVRAAGRSGSESQRCLALSWRAVDLLESGDPDAARRDVDAIAHAVAAGRARRFLAFEARWRGLVALMSGRLADAQRAVTECASRMRTIDDPNAEAYSGIPLALLMFEQGRGADVVKLGAGPAQSWFASYLEHVPALRAGFASVELDLGRQGAAMRVLDQLSANDWAALAADPEQLATTSWLAELCAGLGAKSPAAALYERSREFADRLVCVYAIACRGSMARYVALLARTAGRLDEADRWSERAVAANRAAGADLYVAWLLWEWSQLLRERCAPGDATRSARLAREALGLARSLSLTRLRHAIESMPQPSAPHHSVSPGA
jgi:hypothetical protein